MSSAKTDKLTPAMRQYKAFKAKYPDAILFFRMGDFYELFWDDAKVAAKTLGLTLTSRSKGPEAIPMAGVPFHAVESYLAKMIRAGHRVAICEQIEDPATAKGLVQRDVVRLMTPGTLTDESILSDREANYLAAVLPGRGESDPLGLAWVEMSTGQFCAARPGNVEALLDELCRIRPAECLLPEWPMGADGVERRLADAVAQLTGASVTRRPAWVFERHGAIGKLTSHFDTASMAGFGFEDEGPELLAAGAVLDYLSETQKTTLGHIRRLSPHRGSRFLQVDATTLRALEVLSNMRDGGRFGSLLGAIDETVTAMGSRRLRQWLTYPLRDGGEIEARQDAVAWLLDRPELLKRLRGLLDNVCDIERVVSRLNVNRSSPRDLLGLGRSLRQLPQLESLARGPQADPAPAWLIRCAESLSNLDDLADFVERAISPQAPLHLRDGGVIADGFDAELDRLRQLARGNRDWLAQYQQQLIAQTGIASLRIGFNNVFGYYIEITNAHSDKAPAEFVRRQTLKNAERYITEPLKQYESQVLSAESKALTLEGRLFEQVRLDVTRRTDDLQRLADGLADLDCIAALAAVARSRGYVRPTIVEEPVLRIVNGKHPVLAEMLAENFVANDVELAGRSGPRREGDDRAARLALITGPNMAGKSTYIRQVALLTLLAHTGSFIPAGEATVGLTDRIFTRVGASDELARGQSTFMVEMTETANILNNATGHSLVILDEIGRGTSTYDGLALAWAITEYLATKVRCRCLFATHYHELVELSDLLDGVANFNVAVREWGDQIVFLHRIAAGGADKSYGVHVARLAGVPAEVIRRARDILAELEGNFAREAHGAALSGAPDARPTYTDAGGQMWLFGAPHPLIEEIRRLPIDTLAPLDALKLLSDYQQRLRKEQA